MNNSFITPVQRRRSSGFSLVELLVAAAIGIIASLVIFQVFAVFEGQKRTTTSGGEAQVNGSLALYTIERELRQGGYGMNAADVVGCSVQGWDQQTSAAISPWTFVPAVITQGTGSTPGIAGAPDTVSVIYGSGDLLPAAVTVGVSSLGTTDDFIKVVNPYGFQTGDLVVIAEAGKPCTMAQVNQVPPASGESNRLNLQVGTYDKGGATLPTRYNNPAGLGTAYTINGKVFNLGAAPTIKVFTVQNSQLVVQAVGAPATPLYDGVVQMQAEYGKDINNDGVVDVYNETPPASIAEWAAVMAVRIAVVARSELYEKDEVSPSTLRLWGDSADAPTTTGPVWTLTALTGDAGFDANAADRRHYRYKVFQTVVPLRNQIWRP